MHTHPTRSEIKSIKCSLRDPTQIKSINQYLKVPNFSSYSRVFIHLKNHVLKCSLLQLFSSNHETDHAINHMICCLGYTWRVRHMPSSSRELKFEFLNFWKCSCVLVKTLSRTVISFLTRINLELRQISCKMLKYIYNMFIVNTY